MNRLLSILIVVCVVLAPGFGQAGTVVLKNGHVINGKIIISDDEKVIMSWGNGRTTIYHRFIESISLTEEEKLSLRQYRSAQAVTVSLDVNPAIHLPEFNELHAGDPEVTPVENQGSVSDQPVTDFESEATLVNPSVNVVAPTFEVRNFQRFGFSVSVPVTWSVKEFKDSISLRSDCEGVLIALDRYTGGPMTSGRSAVGLQGMLNDQGFQQLQNGLGQFMDRLDAGFTVESLSPGQNHHSAHSLVGVNSSGEQYLFSLYRTVGALGCSDETLGTVMDSVQFFSESP